MISYIKYGAIALAVIGLFGTGWYVGSMSGKAAVARLERDQAQLTATAVLKERESAEVQAKTDRQAETAHDQDLEAIPLHIRHDVVLVRIPASGSSLSGPQAETSGPHPSGRGAVPGPRERDIRGALEAFKVKWETIVADCRRLDAEWPR